MNQEPVLCFRNLFGGQTFGFESNQRRTDRRGDAAASFRHRIQAFFGIHGSKTVPAARKIPSARDVWIHGADTEPEGNSPPIHRVEPRAVTLFAEQVSARDAPPDENCVWVSGYFNSGQESGP